MLHVVVVVSPLPIFFARRLPFLFLSFFLTWIFRPPLSTWPISLGELIDFIVSGVLSLVWLLSLSLIPQKSVPLSSRSFPSSFLSCRRHPDALRQNRQEKGKGKKIATEWGDFEFKRRSGQDRHPGRLAKMRVPFLYMARRKKKGNFIKRPSSPIDIVLIKNQM
jgi:hypothetical protein